MKKLLIVIVLLCVAGWAGATYVIGGKVQERYLTLTDQFGQLGLLSLTVQNYERGFLSSTAETVLELKVPAPAADGEEAPLRLVFASTLRHGPLPAGAAPGLARIETRLVSVSPGGEEFSRLLDEFPQLRQPLSVSTIDFSGRLIDRTSIPALTTRVDDTQIIWGGLTIDSDYSQARKTLVGSIDMPSLAIRGAEGSLDWDGLHGSFDLVEALPLVYVGKSAVEFGGVTMDLTGEQQKVVRVQGMKVAGESSCDGKLVNFSETLEFGGIDIDHETYGPGVCILEAKHLDGEVLGSFQEQLRQVYADQQLNPDELVARMLPLYTEMLLQLLEQSPELNIRQLRFTTPQGDIDGRLLIRFDGSQGVDRENPLVMLQALDAQADLAMHEKLVRLLLADKVKDDLQAAREQGQLPAAASDAELASQAEQQAGAQLEAVLAQNLAVRDGGVIRSQATFRHGELLLNGQLLPLFGVQ